MARRNRAHTDRDASQPVVSRTDGLRYAVRVNDNAAPATTAGRPPDRTGYPLARPQ